MRRSTWWAALLFFLGACEESQICRESIETLGVIQKCTPGATGNVIQIGRSDYWKCSCLRSEDAGAPSPQP